MIKLDEERDIARLAVDGWTLDFARQVGKTLKDDLSRRDFRINAIALQLENEPKLYEWREIGGLLKPIANSFCSKYIMQPKSMITSFKNKVYYI